MDHKKIAALLLDLQPGDEVIMPSYTFVSTANAFVLRGAIPVFVDIRSDTLNIDESKIAEAITEKTKAIVVVHYAGVGCEMDSICQIAKDHGIFLVEDSAQALISSYKDKPLGSFGDLSCFSFHETKNIISGEGGALIINNPCLADRAEIVREKGTNRSRFFRGEVDKYTWVDLGSSYLPGELIGAFLYAQLTASHSITDQRISMWNYYQSTLASICRSKLITQPRLPLGLKHNAHIYYLIFPNDRNRDLFIKSMKANGIQCVFHYIPLHSSPAGRAYGRQSGELGNTDWVASSLVRLPLFIGLDVDHVVQTVKNVLLELF